MKNMQRNILYQLIQQHPIILVVGITLGLLSSIFITTQVVSQSYQRRYLLYQIEGENYPRYLRQELTVHKSLYVGVISNNLKSTQAVHSTWGQAAVKLEYLVNNDIHTEFTEAGLPFISVSEHHKVFSVLQYMNNSYMNQFNWFMIAGDNLYVRVPRLLKLLTKLDPTSDIYIGAPKTHTFFNVRTYRPFCTRSTGIILSRGLLHKLVPHLKDCFKEENIETQDDATLGKCIVQHIRVQCTGSYEVSKYFYNDYSEGDIFYKARYDKNIKYLITAYPFKRPELMYRIHQYFLEVDIKDHKKKKMSLIEEYRNIRNITKRNRAL